MLGDAKIKIIIRVKKVSGVVFSFQSIEEKKLPTESSLTRW